MYDGEIRMYWSKCGGSNMNGEKCYFCKKPMGNSGRTLFMFSLQRNVNAHAKCQGKRLEEPTPIPLAWMDKVRELNNELHNSLCEIKEPDMEWTRVIDAYTKAWKSLLKYGDEQELKLGIDFENQKKRYKTVPGF